MTPQEQIQLEKFASEYADMTRKAKQEGFITHMSAMGKSAEEICRRHAQYVELDKKRESRYEGLRSAILGK